MKPQGIPRASAWLIAVAALLVPRALRSGWKKEWEAEVWHRWMAPHERRRVLRHCLGAFRDAAWLRLHEPVDFRGWLVSPALRLAATLGLAIGIVLSSRLLAPPPFEDHDRLVMIYQTHHFRNARTGVSPDNFGAWRKHGAAFERMAAFRWAAFRTGENEETPGAFVSPEFFETLRVKASLGRTFSGEGGPREVVLSHAYWQRRYAGDRSVIGRGIPINGVEHTITGVMPAGFWFLREGAHLWARFRPEEHGSVIATLDSGVQVRLKYPLPESQLLGVIARLRSGAGPEAAGTQLRALSSDGGAPVSVIPLQDMLQENARPAGFVLGGAVAVVLLIACGNAVLLLRRRTPRDELRAGLMYWAFFAAKSVVALSVPAAVWFIGGWLSQWAPAGGIHGLVILLLMVWICLLLCCGAIGWSLADQRSRCRVCLRRLRMPVTRGSWASLIIDRPGTEYICPFGHGRLSVGEREPGSWTSYKDPLKEMPAR